MYLSINFTINLANEDPSPYRNFLLRVNFYHLFFDRVYTKEGYT